ncbi:TetR/AcrR family transcriptional regulator [Streptomyces sp. NPDC015140]|uniref:TetR/AcrR family transcriptional regulator n=1 Tax=Streptomyces sp. NPDC015140 TaxID=3364943 RepID=UPI0036FBAE33
MTSRARGSTRSPYTPKVSVRTSRRRAVATTRSPASRAAVTSARPRPREQIFLDLTAEGWREWSAALRGRLTACERAAPAAVADAFAVTLSARPLFCDLLAQAPLNLERNVSLEAVRAFKLGTLEEVARIGAELDRLLGLSEEQAVDTVATATSMAGALWQVATPRAALRELYASEPRLGHAVVEVEPRLRRVLTALLAGTNDDSGTRTT